MPCDGCIGGGCWPLRTEGVNCGRCAMGDPRVDEIVLEDLLRCRFLYSPDDSRSCRRCKACQLIIAVRFLLWHTVLLLCVEVWSDPFLGT